MKADSGKLSEKGFVFGLPDNPFRSRLLWFIFSMIQLERKLWYIFPKYNMYTSVSLNSKSYQQFTYLFVHGNLGLVPVWIICSKKISINNNILHSSMSPYSPETNSIVKRMGSVSDITVIFVKSE